LNIWNKELFKEKESKMSDDIGIREGIENQAGSDNELNFLLAPEENNENGYKVRIKVVGVGGAGGNAVNNMIRAGLTGVEFYHLNSDFKDLEKSLATNKIPIGRNLTQGHGTGGDHSLGEKAALEDMDAIVDSLQGADIVFVAAGMGGGTGTGASGIVAACAEKINAITIAVVTKPFNWEGPQKSARAEEGIKKLQDAAATLLVIPNDNLKSTLPDNHNILDAFKAADDILRQGVQGIANLINKQGMIHRDFGDVKAVLKRGGRAILGIGKAKGENRALEAVKMAANNPLLENASLNNVDKVLLVFSQSIPKPAELPIAAEYIKELSGSQCDISWGTFDEDPNSDELCITVIAASSAQQGKEDDIITLPRVAVGGSMEYSPKISSFLGGVNNDDVPKIAEAKPNSTIIRGRDSSLFDKTPVPGMSLEQPKRNYEVEQVPAFLRNTPNILKKKQV
jgi:cell division protein FtsZ